jgi:hypothetical protein
MDCRVKPGNDDGNKLNPHPEEPAPISGLPEIGTLKVQVGYSRLGCGRLEGWAASAVACMVRDASCCRTPLLTMRLETISC